MRQKITLLAIETSCDETGIALVAGEKWADGYVFKVLKNALLSQAALHAPYGGVFPNLAKREHQKNLPELFEQFKDEAFDAVAVTVGPGLEPALWQGINFAQELAAQKKVPLWAVNHMEAHLISSLVHDLPAQAGGRLEHVRLPVLALLISGGHTEFVLMRDWFSYQVIGETLDDAVGEAFDKVARMLGLPYPGGPEISKFAQAHREAKQIERGLSSAAARELSESSAEDSRTSRDFILRSIKLPRPMLNSNNCDVSFSGLKTAALYALKGKALSDGEKAAFAAEFEEAVGDVFAVKARRALGETAASTFVLGGGVAANRYLRGRLQALTLDEFPDVTFKLPELSITGDNAIMIAQAALCHLLSGDWQEPPKEFRATGNLSIAQKLL